MNTFFAMLLTFGMMLFLPLGLAAFWYFRNKDSVLKVKQNRTRDPRYFAKSFKKIMADAWGKRRGGMISLSGKAEKYLDADKLTKTDYTEPCDCLAIADSSEFCPPEKAEFRKEIYAVKGARIADESVIRAIYSERNLAIGNKVSIDRWADAEGFVVTGDNCDLGISISSASALCIGKKCSFRRMYAPTIYIGVDSTKQKPEMRSVDEAIYALKPSEERKHSRSVSESDENDEGIIPYSFISRGKFKAGENVIIQGSIRAHKGVMLGDNCIVCGSVFSDQNVHMGRNCLVMGDVFSQENIYMESGATLGIPGETHSMIARGNISIEDGCMAHGYISNEAGAKISRVEEEELIPEDGISDEELLDEQLAANKPGLFMMFYKRAISTLGGLLMLGAVILSCLGANYVADVKYKAENRRPVRDVSRYRNQGLYFTETIDSEPDIIGADRIEFSDRVLKLCQWTDVQKANHISGIQQLMAQVKASHPDINSYLLTQPLRIAYEEPFSQNENYLRISAEEKDKQLKYEEELLTACGAYAKPVYLVDRLSQYQNEYIFYRSSELWTARGAYYGAQAFLEASAQPGFKIESFHEIARKDVKGSLQNADESIRDRLYAYLYDNYNPVLNIIDTGEKIPMFSSLRGISKSFMGANYCTAQMNGLADNGRVLLIIGDKSARFVAPWMVTSYESIVYFNILSSRPEDTELGPVFDRFGVTDLLFVDEINNVSNDRMNRKTLETVF